MNVDRTERLYTHFKDRSLFLKAANLADAVAKAEGLTLNIFKPKHRLNEFCALGMCSKERGEISIIIRHKQDKQDGGEWSDDTLPWKNIESTTLHEVAHLKYGNHSREFWQYLKNLIEGYSENKEHAFKHFPKKYNNGNTLN